MRRKIAGKIAEHSNKRIRTLNKSEKPSTPMNAGLQTSFHSRGVCRVPMIIMAMGFMTLCIVPAVPMIIMAMPAVPTMSMVIIFWLFRKLTEFSKCTGQLSRPAEQSDTREHRYIDKLADVVTD